MNLYSDNNTNKQSFNIKKPLPKGGHYMCSKNQTRNNSQSVRKGADAYLILPLNSTKKKLLIFALNCPDFFALSNQLFFLLSNFQKVYG